MIPHFPRRSARSDWAIAVDMAAGVLVLCVCMAVLVALVSP